MDHIEFGPLTRDRDDEPCSDFRPAIPYTNANYLCRCGWPRTIYTHGTPPRRAVNVGREDPA